MRVTESYQQTTEKHNPKMQTWKKKTNTLILRRESEFALGLQCEHPGYDSVEQQLSPMLRPQTEHSDSERSSLCKRWKGEGVSTRSRRALLARRVHVQVSGLFSHTPMGVCSRGQSEAPFLGNQSPSADVTKYSDG